MSSAIAGSDKAAFLLPVLATQQKGFIKKPDDEPEPGILTYITYAHGEKSAGLNFVNPVAIPNVAAPEKLDNYEIGAKTSLFGQHLLLNEDLFWDEDADFQSTIFGPTGSAGTLSAYLANIPKKTALTRCGAG